MKSPIPGPKVLLMGGSGTGKTHAIRTLIPAGITPFVIFTEPGMEVLEDCKCPNLHWNYIAPMTSGWLILERNARLINQLDFASITSMIDSDRQKYTQYLEVLNLCNNYKCSRCGKEFGDVGQWGTDKALVIDSLTGLNTMVMNLTVGGKPVKSMGEWQIAQNTLKRFLDTLTTQTHCTLVMTGHIEREPDEITGGVQLMISTLGKKLAPIIPIYFSDVIQTKQAKGSFEWSTDGYNIEVKGRNVPIRSDLICSFEPLIASWKNRGGVIAPAETGNDRPAPNVAEARDETA